MNENSADIIRIENVSFTYNGERTTGVYDINLSIKEGETVLFCGESGCGKTTLTRLVNGLIPHYYEGTLKGEVCIKGQRINNLPLYETSKIVGSVFQNPRTQFFNVDTTSEIAFGCENQGLPEKEINKRLDRTVSELKLNSLMNRSIFQLSGGEKQKIACASVSAGYPDIFVLDEPSSNLDVQAVDDLKQLIAAWKKSGKTILVAEHRLYYLRNLADRIFYMKDGNIVQEFSADDIKRLSKGMLRCMGLRPLFLEMLGKKGTELLPEAGEMLTVSDFIFSYTGKLPVLDITSFSVPEKSIVAIIGRNGAGKSTFARCLCGLEKHCRGIVKIRGKNCKRKERLKRCYMVMQDVNHQLFTESVFEEVLLGMKEKNETEAEEILSDLDLLPMKELHPMSLSGGQKQRVAIAGAVASERDIIVFDEPTSGLDLRHMCEVSADIRKLREIGKTQFVISHDLEFILECCTCVMHLENGKICNSYPLDESGVTMLKSFFIEEALAKLV